MRNRGKSANPVVSLDGFKPMKLADWKAKAGVDAVSAEVAAELSMALITDKSFAGIASAVEGEPNAVRMVISTADVDRDRDIISVSGWELADYLKNPVVLWAHDYWDLPVARAPRTQIEGGSLVSIYEFTPQDLYPFGHMVGRLVIGGYLNASSVGFIPKEWTYDNDRGGYNILRQVLLESSVCPVPANPNALVVARSAGIDIEPMKGWAERVLDEWHGSEGGQWIPKSNVEAAFKIAAGEKVISIPKFAVSGLEAEDVRTVLTSKSQLQTADGTVIRDFAEDAAPIEVTAELAAAMDEDTLLSAFEAIAGQLKSGRVLSSANETRLRSAVAGIGAAATEINTVLSQLPTASEDDDKGAASAATENAPSASTAAAGSTDTETRTAGDEPTVDVDLDNIQSFLDSPEVRARARELLLAGVSTAAQSSAETASADTEEIEISADDLKEFAARAGAMLADEFKSIRDDFNLKVFGRLPD